LAAGLGAVGIVAGSLATASGAANIIGAFLDNCPTLPATMPGYVDMGLGGDGKVGDLINDIATGDIPNAAVDAVDIGVDEGLDYLEKQCE